jgi:hypothetical protein
VSEELTKHVALLVSVDLLARSRLEDAAARAGWRVETSAGDKLVERLGAARVDLLVLDLDSAGSELLTRLPDADASGVLPERVVGFFSHVDTELAAAARAAGCEAMPRGKFWRSLPALLSG